MQLFWFLLGFTQAFSLVSITGFSPPFNTDSALKAKDSLFLTASEEVFADSRP